MKSSLPSSILLLLATFTSASPVPSRSSKSVSPPDCALTSCHPSLTRLINSPSSSRRKSSSSKSSSHKSTPDHLKITIAVTEEEKTFSKRPLRPSKHSPSSESLSSEKPLSSSYLQSLAHKYPEVKDLEDKVSSYLATHPSPSHSHSASGKKPSTKKPCKPQHMYLPGNVYITTHKYVSRNPDIAVIGVVLVFLLGILAIECAERVAGFFCQKKDQKGKIFLPVEKQQGVISYSDKEGPADLVDVEKSIEPEEWEVVSAGETDAVEFEGQLKTQA